MKPREFWILKTEYQNYIFDEPCKECIHVREVIPGNDQMISALKAGASLYNTSLSDDLIIAQNRIHEQAELIIELRKDSARLEWLLENDATVIVGNSREAIDAAIKDSK